MIRTLRAALALGGRHRARAAVAILLATLATAFGVALMTTAGYLISRAAERPPILSLLTLVVAVRFFGLARPVARYLERLASHDLALRTLGSIRSRFYARIEPLAPTGLEGFRRGDLLDRMITDVDALQGLYPRVILPPAAAALVSVVAVAVAFSLLPSAGITLAAGLSLAGIALPLAAAKLSSRGPGVQASARADLRAELDELVAGAAEIAVYSGQDAATARVSSTGRRLEGAVRADAYRSGIAAGAGLLIAGLTVTAILAGAVAAVSAGTLDRLDVATLALLAIASFEVASGMPSAARELTITLASAKRVLDVHDLEPVIADPWIPLPAPGKAPVVALEAVSARYGPSQPSVLSGVDLRLEPGTRTAVVGPSGAGKTTVVNLLLRFLDPATGRMSIGGEDARARRQEDVRRTFALAGQDSHVFDSSIRQNLLLARPEACEDDLFHALRLAWIDGWVASLPAGLDTLVGEDGAHVSGGQRQRLVIARALLTRAPVLILDEPTAHLDPATARSLMKDVLDATEDRALLLITHRSEGLESMDAVYELIDGRLIARAA